jgi:murein endopeptidase
MVVLVKEQQTPGYYAPAHTWAVACAMIALSLASSTVHATSLPTDPGSDGTLPAFSETTPASDPELIESAEAIEHSGALEEPASVDQEAPAESPAAADAPPTSAESAPPPDPGTLRQLVATHPESLSSLSIGRPDAGALLNAVRMPPGPLWQMRNPERSWGSEETVAFIAAAIETVERRLPGSPPLVIGDISLPRGGSMGRHRSHESGRDADIGWYFTNGAQAQFKPGTAQQMDLPRCWALVRAFVTETDVERIFMDRRLQTVLYRYALSVGEDQQWLLSLFANVSGRSDAPIEHERGHQNHIHVRFYNRRAQEWGRAAYPYLVPAGLAPQPVIVHVARRGETIGSLARRYGTTVKALRAANGLRGSVVRVGRRYHIPVLRSESLEAPPLVVPPRRLPPAKTAVLRDAGE